MDGGRGRSRKRTRTKTTKPGGEEGKLCGKASDKTGGGQGKVVKSNVDEFKTTRPGGAKHKEGWCPE